MTTFLVEQYLPGSNPAERTAAVERVRSAHRELVIEGATHVSSVIVDIDEMCLHLFDADVEGTVVTACAHAGLACDRVVQVDICAPALSALSAIDPTFDTSSEAAAYRYGGWVGGFPNADVNLVV